MTKILTKNVVVVWSWQNYQHYTSLGYKFTDIGDQFSVKVKDLQQGSNKKVKLRCDCGKDLEARNSDIHNSLKRNGRLPKCLSCGQLEFSKSKIGMGETQKAILEILKSRGDIGATGKSIQVMIGSKSNRSFEDSMNGLVRRGLVSKHPSFNHYFYNQEEGENEEIILEVAPQTDEAKVVEAGENPGEETSVERVGYIDRLLSFFGLKRI